MDNEKKYIFDDPQNIKRLLYVLYASCALLFVLDFVVHRHVYHSWENLWGFYPVYGFVGCVVLVLIAKWMRTFLMRPEDYYDNGNITGSDEPIGVDIKNKDKTGGHDVDA